MNVNVRYNLSMVRCINTGLSVCKAWCTFENGVMRLHHQHKDRGQHRECVKYKRLKYTDDMTIPRYNLYSDALKKLKKLIERQPGVDAAVIHIKRRRSYGELNHMMKDDTNKRLHETTDSKYRVKKYYNYMLLDPRGIDVLNPSFDKFLSSIFYIGKGEGNRCYEHFKSTLTNIETMIAGSRKIERIKNIWRIGSPVIVYQGFTRSYWFEAGAREGAMTAAINVFNLCAGRREWMNRSDSISDYDMQLLGAHLIYEMYQTLRNEVLRIPIHTMQVTIQRANAMFPTHAVPLEAIDIAYNLQNINIGD